MSRSLNKVQLIGNVGNDPEVRATSSGTRVAKLSLATNRTWKDKSGQEQEATDWHRLTCFGKLADIVEQWVYKGDKLYVEGRIQYSQTQDDQGGTRYWTDVIVEQLLMLGGNKEDREPSPRQEYERVPARQPEPSGGGTGEPQDDLLFAPLPGWL